MKLTINRLKYNNSSGNWVWNLNGRECKLQVSRTTFKPTSKTLGFNQAEAHKQAEILNDKFYQFKNGITSKEYTFGWCIQKFMQSVIQSTCCSIDTGILVRTDGLPGPVMVNIFGKFGIASPR